MNSVISPLETAASLTEFWSPRVIAELDDSYVKVAKLKGSLAWHSHDDEDELFVVRTKVVWERNGRERMSEIVEYVFQASED